jgi:hypothetical protein
MTIYDIKNKLMDSAPAFFSRETLKFFGQTMKDFRVFKQKDGKFLLVAPIMGKTRFSNSGIYCKVGETRRVFNPETNRLEREILG